MKKRVLQLAEMLAVLGFLAPFAIAPAAAETDKGGNADDGHVIAQSLCARCHAVEKTGESPVGDAPPFRTFIEMWPLESLEEALAEGIMVGHPRHQMPVFKFSPSEIADLIAYLETLAPKKKSPDERG